MTDNLNTWQLLLLKKLHHQTSTEVSVPTAFHVRGSSAQARFLVRMCARGFVQRYTLPGEGRKAYFAITPSGTAFCREQVERRASFLEKFASTTSHIAEQAQMEAAGMRF